MAWRGAQAAASRRVMTAYALLLAMAEARQTTSANNGDRNAAPSLRLKLYMTRSGSVLTPTGGVEQSCVDLTAAAARLGGLAVASSESFRVLRASGDIHSQSLENRRLIFPRDGKIERRLSQDWNFDFGRCHRLIRCPVIPMARAAPSVRQWRFADGVDVKADAVKRLVIENIPAIEDARRLHHTIEDAPVI